MAVFLKFLIKLVEVYTLIIVVRALMSWFVRDYNSNPLVSFIYKITEPLMQWVRRVIPLQFGMMDFSIIIIFIGLYLIKEGLNKMLLEFLLR